MPLFASRISVYAAAAAGAQNAARLFFCLKGGLLFHIPNAIVTLYEAGARGIWLWYHYINFLCIFVYCILRQRTACRGILPKSDLQEIFS